jgi:hypothetical protein
MIVRYLTTRTRRIAAVTLMACLIMGTYGEASAQQRGPALARVTVIVSDIERSIDVYGRIGLVSQ